MPTNKNASLRYLTLDACFRNFRRRYYIEDLIQACNDALGEFNGSEVRRRQVFDDITFMESEQGYSIPLDRLKDGRRVYYRYKDSDFFIRKQPITEEEIDELRQAINLLGRFQGLPQYAWLDELTVRLSDAIKQSDQLQPVVCFEQNPFLKGLEYFGFLYQSIIKGQCLTITYKSFKKDVAERFEVHPYYLKQFNSRWFLFGRQDKWASISNLALDRILAVEENSLDYIQNSIVDFYSYFEDVIGVTVDETAVVEEILLLISPELWPYVETKPIHGSMRVIKRSEEGVQVRLDVKINYELISLLFALGEGVKIISPLSLNNRVLEKAKKLILNNS